MTTYYSIMGSINHQLISQQISALENLRYQYLLKEQYDKFTALCHSDLTYVHTSGKVDDFLGYTEKCKQGFYKYTKAKLSIERINIFESVVMVFGELKSEFFAGADFKKLHNKILSIWIYDNGEWKFFAYHPTAIV